MRRLLRWLTGYAWTAAGPVPCTTWPCRRCDRAGRGGWRSREAWHHRRRRRALVWAAALLVGGLGWAAALYYAAKGLVITP